jgi:signal transduction histidine kinase
VNRRLEAEVAERIAAEEGLRQAQADLIQAAKLAALGQMSAALSHEFNQPLAAVAPMPRTCPRSSTGAVPERRVATPTASSASSTGWRRWGAPAELRPHA